jgi:glycerol-3-phosphate O-acyltransferase
MLALRAARELAQKDCRVLVVPVSIKTTHVADVKEQVRLLMMAVAMAVQLEVKTDAPMFDLLKQVGVKALGRNLQHRGIELGECHDLTELIELSAGRVMDQLEAKMQLKPKPGNGLIERVRQARRAIHQVRTDTDRVADHEAAGAWADEAMLAFRIASYHGDYVRSNPTIDRVAETVQKLGEDVFSCEQRPLGTRRAIVNFGEPIDTGDYLDAYEQKARKAVRLLTEVTENRVQKGIDAINDANRDLGGQLWSDEGE